MIHGTTVLALLYRGSIALAGDGQLTFGATIFKAGATKLRRLYGGRVVAGFAGSAADSISLFEQFERRLEETRGQLTRAAVELARDWRTDKMLRRLESMLVVGDSTCLLTITGTGDVVEPDDGVAAIGSGGPYALAAARAFKCAAPEWSAEVIVREALKIASSICIYTNSIISVESLP